MTGNEAKNKTQENNRLQKERNSDPAIINFTQHHTCKGRGIKQFKTNIIIFQFQP